MCALRRTTDATIELWTTAELKLHLRVDGSTDDTLIDNLGTAARQSMEVFLNRSLVTQTWTLELDGFPSADGGLIELRRAPVQTVTTVKYYNSSGVQTTLTSGTDYQKDVSSEPARVIPEPDTTWPTVETGRLNAVEVVYVAGYGDAATDVPLALRQAHLLMVGHFYEHREEVTEGKLVQIPVGAERLLWQYRIKEA